jgi:hypothetical protein
MFLHGVAFLRGIDTPSLTAQGEQRRSSFFNIDRDIPPNLEAILYLFDASDKAREFRWFIGMSSGPLSEKGT